MTLKIPKPRPNQSKSISEPDLKDGASSEGKIKPSAEGTQAHTISAVNKLPVTEKREIYSRLIPDPLIARFNLSPDLKDPHGQDLLILNCDPDSAVAEMELYHKPGFPDPVLYGHISDTINGQIHVLFYVLSDPTSPRFDIDRLPDGTPTQYGTQVRNLEAEAAAMEYGLAPGQIRRGLRLLGPAIQSFESFITSLEQEFYFAEPLYYHNAAIFEGYGLGYEKGRRLMERIHAGFEEGGDLRAKLDGSTPFRQPHAANSIRLRSWALHDNLMGEPFTGVTMYKHVNKSSDLNTCPGWSW
jgi:acetoin utilization protein AcuC